LSDPSAWVIDICIDHESRWGRRFRAKGKEANRKDYTGDGACEILPSRRRKHYLHTAHHLTSQLPSKNSMAANSQQEPILSEPSIRILRFTMARRKGSYYETAIFWQPPMNKSKPSESIWWWAPDKEARPFVLERRPAVSVAGIVLGSSWGMGEQSRLYGRYRRF